MRKQREEEDFWDKNKNFQSKFSFDELDSAESSLDRYNFNKEIFDERKNR